MIGVARSGRAAGLLLRTLGNPVYASDAAVSPALEETAQALREAGCDVELGGHDLARIGRAGFAVVSPGVPPDAAPLRAARDAGVPVISELDLGARMLPATRLACVTGSNGKTTTTALTAHLLRTAGLSDAEAAGNIGNPICSVAMRGHAPAWLAVECSSFQLHDAPSLAPAAGVLTNLSPNHLDRYRTLEEYYGDKALLFRNATPESRWVVNGDDAAAMALAAGATGHLEPFSLETRLAAGYFDRAGGGWCCAARPPPPGRIPPRRRPQRAERPRRGAGDAPGDRPRRARRGLRTFQALEHRLEPVREVAGVRWINDSKSTSVAATVVALRSMDRPFVLLIGGGTRRAPYTDLRPLLANARGVIAFGEAGDAVEKDLAGAAPLERGGDFADVLARARRLTRPGDAVLLSPACSSYDMFDNSRSGACTFKRLGGAF